MLSAAQRLASLGPAPYTFVSMETADDREAANTAAAAAGLPFTTNTCGGSCDLCGTSIWNVFRFRCADGTVFKVGCDCADKVQLGDQVKQARRDRRKSEREAAYRRSVEERLEAERNANEAAGDGRLTNDELQAKIREEREAAEQARRDASRHFGSVKERVRKVALRYEGHYAFESYYGIQVLFFLRTVEGDNAVVWKTSAGLPDRKDGTEINKGESFVATFTIKEHGEYRGEQQTKVSRLVVH